jgi:tRNA A37 threonylcarbamoyladenosine synthetase subunit TsaC/SUA5/YrdC
MKTISLEEFLQQQDFYISEANAGKIFVYPTDTIYGI